MSRKLQFFNGWQITEQLSGPATGRWRATRFGVSIGSSTYGSLIAMIEQRNRDERERQEARA